MSALNGVLSAFFFHQNPGFPPNRTYTDQQESLSLYTTTFLSVLMDKRGVGAGRPTRKRAFIARAIHARGKTRAPSDKTQP
jgi:hypothetical protein